MTQISTPGAPVKRKIKDINSPGTIAMIVIAVVGGMRDFPFGYVIPIALMVGFSSPANRREMALSLLGAILVAGLLAGAEMADRHVGTVWPTAYPAWTTLSSPVSIIFFLPAFIALWLIFHSTGLVAATPGPEDELGFEDVGKWRGTILVAVAFAFGLLLAMLEAGWSAAGCDLPLMLPFLGIVSALLAGGIAILGWVPAGALRLGLVLRCGLCIAIPVGAWPLGHWLDCAVEGGWQGPAAMLGAILIYGAALFFGWRQLKRYVRRHAVLRWSASRTEPATTLPPTIPPPPQETP